MHKKSIEAADALKSSDENGSDKEDDRTEASDTSSSNYQRRSPINVTTNPMEKPKQTSNGTPIRSPSPAKSSSISPLAMSPPASHHHHHQAPPPPPTSQHNNAMDSENKGKEYNNLLPSPHSSRTALPPGSFHHLNHHDTHTAPPTHVPHHHHHPLNHHPLNPLNHSPDTDPEVFRWVNYNRDPVSYIR
jgi:hypothetical protein